MGLFQGKHGQVDSPIDENNDGVQRFFEGYFEKLRERGRAEFEKSVEFESKRFKNDLTSTISKANTELRAHIAKQLYEQFVDNDKAIQNTEKEALTALNRNVEAMEKRYQELSNNLEKSITKQSSMFTRIFEESMARVKTMQDAQDAALRSLDRNVQALEEQHRTLSASLQESVTKQEDMLVETFEGNMAQIIEHYLLGALGDQYDVKAQLPAIIKQMEANKQAIVDDMKL